MTAANSNPLRAHHAQGETGGEVRLTFPRRRLSDVSGHTSNYQTNTLNFVPSASNPPAPAATAMQNVTKAVPISDFVQCMLCNSGFVRCVQCCRLRERPQIIPLSNRTDIYRTQVSDRTFNPVPKRTQKTIHGFQFLPVTYSAVIRASCCTSSPTRSSRRAAATDMPAVNGVSPATSSGVFCVARRAPNGLPRSWMAAKHNGGLNISAASNSPRLVNGSRPQSPKSNRSWKSQSGGDV